MRNRLHALCSYFAMFPETFAEHWLNRLTDSNDLVLDPVCGRGTLPFQALLMGRRAVGCDINPVAYCISRAKTCAPHRTSVLRRLGSLEREFDSPHHAHEESSLPPFFRHAYASATLRQL